MRCNFPTKRIFTIHMERETTNECIRVHVQKTRITTTTTNTTATTTNSNNDNIQDDSNTQYRHHSW